MKFICVKRPDNTLAPVYNSDLEIVSKLKDGQQILLDFRKSRNPKHHKLVFAKAKCCLENIDGPWGHLYMMDKNNAPYKFIKALMFDIGLTDDLLTVDGDIVQIPMSIAWENMSEDEFQPISRMLSEKCAEFLKITVEEFDRNYQNYL